MNAHEMEVSSVSMAFNEQAINQNQQMCGICENIAEISSQFIVQQDGRIGAASLLKCPPITVVLNDCVAHERSANL